MSLKRVTELNDEQKFIVKSFEKYLRSIKKKYPKFIKKLELQNYTLDLGKFIQSFNFYIDYEWYWRFPMSEKEKTEAISDIIDRIWRFTKVADVMSTDIETMASYHLNLEGE